MKSRNKEKLDNICAKHMCHVKSKKYSIFFLQLPQFFSLPSHISVIAMLVKWQC